MKEKRPSVEDLLRAAAGREVMEQSADTPCDTERIWAFVDGECPEDQEEEVFAHLKQCASCAKFAMSIWETRREVAAEPGWSVDRIMTLLRERRPGPKSRPGTVLQERIAGSIIDFGRSVLRLFDSAMENLVPAPMPATVPVRGDGDSSEESVTSAQWSGEIEGMNLTVGFEASSKAGDRVILNVETTGGNRPVEGELELVSLPDTVREIISTDDLPARLEVPAGKGCLRFVAGDRNVEILTWDLEEG